MSAKSAKSNNLHIPMNSSSDIDIVRATLSQVMPSMGYRYTVRHRENETIGSYASVSLQPVTSTRTRRTRKNG